MASVTLTDFREQSLSCVTSKSGLHLLSAVGEREGREYLRGTSQTLVLF